MGDIVAVQRSPWGCNGLSVMWSWIGKKVQVRKAKRVRTVVMRIFES